jgi:hypothetical protein
MTVCGRAKIRFTDHPTSHLVAKPLYNNNNNNNSLILDEFKTVFTVLPFKIKKNNTKKFQITNFKFQTYGSSAGNYA